MLRQDDGQYSQKNTYDSKPNNPQSSPVRRRSDNENSTSETGRLNDADVSPRTRQRLIALEQADAVLTAIGGDNYLDGFNLLGVIANPRAGSSSYSPAASSPSSVHGRYNAVGSPDPTRVDTQSGISSYFQSFEQTVSQVSESMGMFNNVLDDWTRNILEDDPTGGSALPSSVMGSAASIMNPLYAIIGGSSNQDEEDQIPESQIKTLPDELENLNVKSALAYVHQCGPDAASFQQIRGEDRMHNRSISHSDVKESDGLETIDSNSDKFIDVSDIPAIFFDEEFDLTNPETFCGLLLSDKGSNILNISTTKNSSSEQDASVFELFPVIHQDSFNAHLDKIEISLLQQVRANSGKFFEESQRFAGLHEDIHNMLASVEEQRSINLILQKDMIKTAEIIPICDVQREQLRLLSDVLDRSENLLQCKNGLAGVLSAQDDLTAIEQIQYGRKLLQSSNPIVTDQMEVPAFTDEKATSSITSSQEVSLKDLRALQTVAAQLDQYEELVVNNLRDELVEIFLAWGNHTVPSQTSSSLYGNSTNNNPLGNGTSNASILKENVRNRVLEINGALKSCQSLTIAKEAYQNRLQDVIRMTVRTTVAEFASDSGSSSGTISAGATAMSLNRFLDCLDMLFEQLVSLLTSAVGVASFYASEGLLLHDQPGNGKDDKNDDTTLDKNGSHTIDSNIVNTQTTSENPLSSVVAAAAESSSKSISELLRLRKDAHSLVSLEEMKSIWDACMDFSSQIENLCYTATVISSDNGNSTNNNTSLLKNTLLAQAKAFVERKHESHMSALVAALDSERWVQCDVSFERQTAVSRLCSGRAVIALTASHIKSLSSINGETSAENAPHSQSKKPEIEAEGVRYKVVWSCLLLVEMILTNIATSAQFPSLSSNNINKIAELLRLFNSRTMHLVLGAGAIHSNARLKSINAKHLSLVTQCLGLILSILPHVRAALAAQMPNKQHALLTVIDQIKREYVDHNEKILNKFVTIIGGIVEHQLAKQINETDFDVRAGNAKTMSDTSSDTIVACCTFLDGVSSNTKKMHQVLTALLPPDHLKDVFSRIYAFIDSKVPALFIAAAEASENEKVAQNMRKDNSSKANANSRNPSFKFPLSIEGKRQFLLELEATTKSLNGLEGIHPWDFTARNVLERRLEYFLDTIPDNEKDMEVNETSAEQENGRESGEDTNEVLIGNSMVKEDIQSDDSLPIDNEIKDDNGTESKSEKLEQEDSPTTNGHNATSEPSDTGSISTVHVSRLEEVDDTQISTKESLINESTNEQPSVAEGNENTVPSGKEESDNPSTTAVSTPVEDNANPESSTVDESVNELTKEDKEIKVGENSPQIQNVPDSLTS